MNKKIAVFCGSAKGHLPVYENEAIRLAQVFVKNNISMVYGGGSVGLMGVIADEMMSLGGEVIGVIPQKLKDMEVGHDGITKLHIVNTMHERKAMMADLSDAFIALPGGIGTIEEIIEVYTWLQLGYHDKPCGFLNINGYYEKFFEFLDQMTQEGFLKRENRIQINVDSDIDRLLSKL